MDEYEKLIAETPFDVNIDENHHFKGKLSGLYVDGNIALSDKLKTSKEKVCVLAEELGHHHTTYGNIIDMRQAVNRKQERKARLWGYNRLIGLYGLIRAFEKGCRNKHEIAEYLEVTEDYLDEAMKCYREKYGEGKGVDNYYVSFEPSLQILKMI